MDVVRGCGVSTFTSSPFFIYIYIYIYIYPLSPMASTYRSEFNNSSSNGRWTEVCVCVCLCDYWLFNGRVAPLSCVLGIARFFMFHQYEPNVQEPPQGKMKFL